MAHFSQFEGYFVIGKCLSIIKLPEGFTNQKQLLLKTGFVLVLCLIVEYYWTFSEQNSAHRCIQD